MFVIIKNILKFVRHHSCRKLFARLSRTAVKPLFESADRYIVRLKLLSVTESDPNLNIKELTVADLDKMLEVMYVSQTDLQKRFSSDHRCFAIFEAGKILCYFWSQLGLKNFHEVHLKFDLRSNQVWMYNAVTVKAARGRNLYPNIIRYMAKTMARSGIDEAFIDVDPGNTPSFRGLKKAGCTPVVMIRMRKILSKTKYNLTILDNNAWQQLSQIIENFDSIQYVMESNIHS